MRDGDRVIETMPASLRGYVFPLTTFALSVLLVTKPYLLFCIVAQRDDPYTMADHDGGQGWSATGPKAPTEGRNLKLRG